MKHFRTIGSLLVVLVLVGAIVAVAGSARPTFTATALTPGSTFTGDKSLSGSLAKTDPSLLGRTSSAPVNVLVKYDFDATASYGGGVAGLTATSPAVTGKKLKNNRAAVRAYERHAAQVSSAISAAVQQTVPGVTIRQSYETVYGGVAAQVPANKIADLLKVDGVAAVQRDTPQQPQTDATPEFIGATAVWPSIGGPVHGGENVVVGVIDTGIWPEHPSFANHGLPAPPGGPYGCEFGDGSDVAHLGPKFACNRKLVGAYAFTDTYLDVIGAEPGEYCNQTTGVCSARDPEGHGSHTASTAAGGPVANTPIFGIDRGPISGLAPGARVIMYRVCLEQGCFPSDSVQAVGQAIDDGADVLNYSISGGGNAYADAVELAFLDAFNAGISVNASAGNSGPGAATADHGGPWVTTVGASTSPRTHRSTAHLVASNGDTFDLVGSTITPGIAATPVVLSTAIGGNDDCTTPLAPGSATGKIVVCVRSPGRVLKGFNVKNAGGVGMILINPINEPAFIMTDNHWIPSIHANGPPTALLAYINGHVGVTATWATGAKAAQRADAMTQFSSRGPLGDFVKPDVTAPGLQILAAMTPTPSSPVGGPPGQLFQVIGGTSMSSPHSAGVSALVKAAHPDWTPAMIKSAMMTSAAQGVLKEDILTPADPFDAGAGSIRANRAVNPTLVFDETFADFVASASDPLHRIDLNLASVNAPTMTGLITTKRTAINVSGSEQTLDVSTEEPPGGVIIVSDKAPGPNGPVRDDAVRLKRNGPTDIWITISAPTVADGQYFGRITLDPRKNGLNDVTIPVAFTRQQGVVTLTHTCSPTSFAKRTGSSHCTVSATNLSSIAADTDLTVREMGVTKARAENLRYVNIGAPGSPIGTDAGVQWHGTLSPSLPPTVDSITPTEGPDGGYLALSLLGVAPVAGVGDDTITNFTVPPFYYGGELYSQIGVVSNGYIVVGGGTGADLVYRPQTFPNPAPPNNVLAGLWTDLDPSPTGGGSIRVAVLSGGGFSWIVVDWAGVKNFGNATTHSFEIWLQRPVGPAGTGPESEAITYSYGPNLTFPDDGTGLGNAGSGDPGSGQNWGAENRNGTSGKNITPAPPNGSEWAVNTSPPQPGGSVTIPFDVTGRNVGVFDSIASLTSNVTPGTTQEVETLRVTQ